MSEWMLIVKLNKHVWSHGIQSVPRRVRIHIACNRNNEEDAKEEFFYTSHFAPEGLKGLGTIVFMLQSCYFYKIWVTVVS